MKNNYQKRLLITVFLTLGAICFAFQNQVVKAQNKPLTYVEIITALNTKVPNQAFKNKMEIIDYIIRQVNFVGIEGELTPDVEKLLWQAGASDQLMKAIRVKSQSSIKSKPNGTSAKTYLEMSENEKRDFIEVKTNEFLDKFGRTEADKIPTKAVNSIKMFVGDYLRRISVDEAVISKGNNNGMVSKNNCLYGRGNLANILKRGSSYSRNIVESFVNKGVQPEVGIYIAFIESEFCPCLQAPTGPLGMFQLTTATASNYGVKAIKGASPESPDERCNPKAAAFGAAAYIKMMSDKFYGKDVNGIYFTVAAFNSGEGGLNKNIRTVREIKNGKQNVTFWDLVENADKLTQQFQSENLKYVPKFLAAAIIGENPKSFGLVEFQPLSVGTKSN